MNIRIGKIKQISPLRNAFTSVLSGVYDPPATLNYAGELPDKRPVCVAIVGTRKPSEYGKQVTEMLAYDLAKLGIYVISGLAFGIDTIAHQATMRAGGKTIAILPTGLDRIYPASHTGVAEEIVKSGGALLSEYPANTSAMRHHFLQRNRLISGLADAVVVTEATERSATLSTVNHALEQNKEVFAVPGPINSLLSVGPNQLIRQGAGVVLSAKDIINVIAPELSLDENRSPVAMTTNEAIVLAIMKKGVKDGDEILKRSKLEVNEYLETLTMLEVSGAIRPLGGNFWSLT